MSLKLTRLTAGIVLLLAGCSTVDLGDNIVPPDLRLDEDFFYCEIQPNVLSAKPWSKSLARQANLPNRNSGLPTVFRKKRAMLLGTLSRLPNSLTRPDATRKS